MSDETQTTELIPVDQKERLGELVAYMGGLQELVVTNDVEHQEAAGVLREVKGYRNEAIEARKVLTGPLKADVAVIEDAYRPIVQAMENFIDKTGEAVGNYQAAVDRKREQEENRAAVEAEAKRKAEAAKADAAIKKAAQLRAEGKEKQAQIQEVKAEAALTTAEETVAVVPEYRAPAGTSFTVYYEAVVSNKARAVGAILGDKVLGECLQIDLKTLCKLQVAAKGHMEVPGITFTKKKRVSSRKG